MTSPLDQVVGKIVGFLWATGGLLVVNRTVPVHSLWMDWGKPLVTFGESAPVDISAPRRFFCWGHEAKATLRDRKVRSSVE
ncbi:hypothetical protein GCM10027563_20720 [Parasphingorhabdus pacifica]